MIKKSILVLGDLKDYTSFKMINIILKSRYFRLKILILPKNNLHLKKKYKKDFLNTIFFFNGRPNKS